MSTGSITAYLGLYFRFSDSQFSSSCSTISISHKYCCTDLLSCDFLHEKPSLTSPLLTCLHRSLRALSSSAPVEVASIELASPGDWQLELNTAGRAQHGQPGCQGPAGQGAEAAAIALHSASRRNHPQAGVSQCHGLLSTALPAPLGRALGAQGPSHPAAGTERTRHCCSPCTVPRAQQGLYVTAWAPQSLSTKS